MKLRKPLIALALACTLPAFAQTSSSTVTTTNGQTTSITGGTGDGSYSASGMVVDSAQDQLLLREIVTTLANDPAMAGAQINVQVVGGRVTLNGIALGIAQAEAARSIAQRIAGSANVSSNLSTSRQ